MNLIILLIREAYNSFTYKHFCKLYIKAIITKLLLA